MKNFNLKENFAAWTVIVIGVGVLGFFVLNLAGVGNLFKSSEVAQQAGKIRGSSISSTAKDTISSNLDTDEDGLTDIIERRIGTDPRKEDTDNDGYTDKEEIDNGHDPLINAQKIAEIQAAQADDPLFKVSSGTVYGSGGNNTPSESGVSDAESLGDLALLNTTINNGNIHLPEIPDSTIKLSSSEGRVGVEEYLYSVLAIGFANVPYLSEQSFMSAFLAVQSGSTSEIEKLISTQATLYEQIKEIPAPLEMIDFHKKLLGTLQLSLEAFDGLKNTFSGPSSNGLDSVSKFQVVMINFRDLANQLRNHIENYNLVFPGI